MNKTRLKSIEKALGEMKAKDEPNPYEDWSLEQLKDHYASFKIDDSELARKLNSMTLPDLLKMWETYSRTGEMI